MAAGKVSRLNKSYGYGVKNNVGCGKKRGLFEFDVEVKVKGKKSMEIGEGIEGSNPRKKRVLSHVVCGEGGNEGVKIRPSLVVGRGSSFDDGEVVDCELDQEGFSGAMNVNVNVNVLMSRWGCDDELEMSGEERSLSVESEVIQREGSLSSKDGDEGGCLVRGVEDDDCMEVGVCEGRDSGGIGARRCMLESCRSVCDEYENVGKISEGAYGVVYKARGKKSREPVALKKLKLGDEREGFAGHFLREINVLLSINHPSIVNVREVVLDERGHGLGDVYLVMDYVEHDLQRLMEVRKQGFSQSEVKCLMLQLLEGVSYLHDNWLIHRDLKTSNLLYNNQGELKICYFGMSRQYGSSPLKPYTALVVTLWYRAPELLLGAKKYSTAVDMWSVGCMMAELLTSKPFFEGKNELDQLDKIFRKLGTPNEKIWPDYPQLPGVKANFVHQPYNLLHKEFPRASFTSSPTLSDLGLDLLSRLLTYDPEKRITAEEALYHRWFQEVPLPTSKEFMPTFPAAPRVS